jgi:two-component system chemotaxis sensor kinase CheA
MALTTEALVPVVTAAAAEPAEARARVTETVRVEIERLDHLMNLAGELVVNKARFVQVARQMRPAFKKAGVAGRARASGESMRRALLALRAHGGADAEWSRHLDELEAEIGALEEQSRLWEQNRRLFGQLTEAIDQLTRVSSNLQRRVLETRMVPVAPLFNRFKRVVRDIALELNKQVLLEIKGEKTELDKRMIDELGDPLIHLVRNAIDHGIEAPDVRARRGKPAAGTLCLEAAHSGNNVYISVRDDGGGIDTDKIRERVRARGLAGHGLVDSLSERDLIDYIWHPGFSTAEAVSDLSGRGVGMDVVKTRLSELNGTIDVRNAPGQGTTFTLRLPLTLAIIRSLLFRLQHGTFAVPIDNVREIVSVPIDQVVTIHTRKTFEVRGEFIPLVDIADVFDWPMQEGITSGAAARDAQVRRLDVVILHSSSKTMGLRVNELLGGQDIVIKSLAENFVPIRGLSGASILGDGSVCLLLDAGAVIELAGRARLGQHERSA